MHHSRPDYQDRIQDALLPEEGGIPVDEPVFLLRGQDKLAALTVRLYALLADVAGADPALVAGAMAQAAAMEAWLLQKLPDLPQAKPPPDRLDLLIREQNDKEVVP